jgi:hypothetical protein
VHPGQEDGELNDLFNRKLGLQCFMAKVLTLFLAIVTGQMRIKIYGKQKFLGHQ